MKRVFYTLCVKTPGIECSDVSNCGKCGWDPAVTEKRKARLRRGEPAIPKGQRKPGI